MSSKENETEGLIRLLTDIADSEIDKPEKEMDCLLIKRCSELIEQLRGDHADREVIKTEIAAIKARNRRMTASRAGAKKKRAAWIAAACAALAICAVPITIRAATKPSAADLLSDFGMDCTQDSDIGTVRIGENVINETWEKAVYGSVISLLSGEKLRILYPTKLPEGVHVEKASVYESELDDGSTGDIVIFTFTDPSVSMSVCCFDLFGDTDFSGYETAEIKGRMFYIRSEEENVWRAVGSFDSCSYSVSCSGYDDLIAVLEGLETS